MPIQQFFQSSPSPIRGTLFQTWKRSSCLEKAGMRFVNLHVPNCVASSRSTFFSKYFFSLICVPYRVLSTIRPFFPRRKYGGQEEEEEEGSLIGDYDVPFFLCFVPEIKYPSIPCVCNFRPKLARVTKGLLLPPPETNPPSAIPPRDKKAASSLFPPPAVGCAETKKGEFSQLAPNCSVLIFRRQMRAAATGSSSS